MSGADYLPGGGPAFPCDPFIASRPGHESVAKRLAEGMTLRDYFAAQFMARAQSLCETNDGWDTLTAAQCAYQMADAMLEARLA